ncbi:glycosyltransferase [Microbacterium testaceum]|uniref:glycosyltransferase n=1 Tax=Microbacterium testaceum TaxID=2033 RepID=UPI0012AD0220|nr:hypothetical protein [Microbacterium testaceum]
MREAQRAVVFSVGDDRVASSRVRAGSVVRELSRDGWSCHRVSAGSTKAIATTIANAFFGKDLVVVQKLTPSLIAGWLIRRRARRLAYEIDDAIYLGYPGDSTRISQKRARRLFRFLKHVDVLVTSNELIANDLRDKLRPGTPVHIAPGPAPSIPTLVEPEAGPRSSVLWLGSPSTYPLVSPYLSAIGAAAADLGLTFVVVGAPDSVTSASASISAWSPEAAQESLSNARLGVMPMTWDAWSRRKAAYKILEYLANGVIPVAEDSPAIRTLLGEERHELGVFYAHAETVDWTEVFQRALHVDVDEAWKRTRRRVFDRWSEQRFAMLFVEDNV